MGFRVWVWLFGCWGSQDVRLELSYFLPCRLGVQLGLRKALKDAKTGTMQAAGIRGRGDCKDTLGLGTEGILLTAGMLCCYWALQGYVVVGHCRDTHRLGTAGILIGWALQGYLVLGSVRHLRDT